MTKEELKATIRELYGDQVSLLYPLGTREAEYIFLLLAQAYNEGTMSILREVRQTITRES